MDTSEQYIKMCDCEEIQELFNTVNSDMPHVTVTQHDYIWCKKHKILWHTTPSGCLCVNYEPCTVIGIWLPRQDQLQEMITYQDLANYEVCRPSDPPLIDNLLSAFSQFCNRLPWMGKAEGVDNRPSMEQLCLAFVMAEKHNKIWVNDKWEVRE